MGWVLATLIILGAVSFGLSLTRLQGRRLKTIGLVFLAVAIATPVLFAAALVLPVQVGTTCCSSTTLGASINVPFGTGNGTVSIQLTESSGSTYPVTAVSFADQSLASVNPVPGIGSLVLSYQGKPLSADNPLPPGGTASGSVEVPNLKAGVAYEIEITTNLGNGSQEVQTISVTAQA